MTTNDDSDVPRRREPDRAELGEMVWKGHGGRRPRVLAYGGSGEKPLALGENHVYWAEVEDGSIARLPKDGGVPLVLASDQIRPAALALHDGFLYWATGSSHTEPGRIVRMPEDGGDIETLATGTTWPQSISVAGRDVYWTDCGDGVCGTVMRGSIDGATPVVLATKQKQPDSIVADGPDLYWTNTGNKHPSYFMDGSVMRMRREDGKKRWIVRKDLSMPSSVVLDEEFVYWTTATMYHAPYESGAIFRRPRAGGEIKRLASLQQHGAFLAVDATHVYCMTSHEGPMFRLPKAGGEPERLLSSVDAAFQSTFVCGLAIDDRFLYWTATFSGMAGGAVWKLAK